MKFPPYQHYKDSGIDWLGEIPEHWEQLRLSWLFKRSKTTNRPDAELLSIYRDYGVIPKSSRDDNFNKPSHDLSTYQLVQVGDLVLNKMKTWQGSIAISEFEGIVSPAYFVAKPRREFILRFVHYLLRSPVYISQYLRYSKGIRPNQWDLDFDDFRVITAILPPIEEQKTIAGFLDAETLKIDELISKQEQLITLLREKRQALISHAVTKGLNSSPSCKDPGTNWLGEVPEHWEPKRLKWISKSVQTGGTPSNTKDYFNDGQLDWYTPGDFNSGLLLKGAAKKINVDAVSDNEVRIFPVNSILIVGIGATLGKIGLIEKDSSANQQINAVIPQTTVHSKFLAYSLSVKTDAMLVLSNASTIGIMNQEKTKQIPIAVPPLSEQKEIAAYLDGETVKIDALMEKARGAIKLLQEHRIALISAAVTGKIDVRQYRNGNLSNN